jgi:hypothetical protein
VADGVVDQVAHQALGQAGIAQGRGGVERGIDAEHAAPYLCVPGQQDLVGDGGQVEPLPPVQSCLSAGQDEQGLQQPLLLLGDGQDALEGGS